MIRHRLRHVVVVSVTVGILAAEWAVPASGTGIVDTIVSAGSTKAPRQGRIAPTTMSAGPLTVVATGHAVEQLYYDRTPLDPGRDVYAWNCSAYVVLAPYTVGSEPWCGFRKRGTAYIDWGTSLDVTIGPVGATQWYTSIAKGDWDFCLRVTAAGWVTDTICVPLAR